MSRARVFLLLSALLIASVVYCFAGSDPADRYRFADGRYAKVLTGQALWSSAAKQDTVALLGSRGPASEYYGDFEDELGYPSWDRWVGVDMTQRTEPRWHIDTFNANTTPCLQPALSDTAVNHAWWCGEHFYACAPNDPEGGYGNDYEEYLDWWGQVDPDSFDVDLDVDVDVTARLSYDNEPGYDYLYLEYENIYGDMIQFATPGVYNGKQVCVPVDETQPAVAPIDRAGNGGKWVHLRWRFSSDGGWSDQDCDWPTEGAAQIDSICVFFSQGDVGPLQVGQAETCEDLDGDGEFEDDARWEVAFPIGVGDYARVWALLQEIDPCCINTTPQVAFIAHPITGLPPYSCTTWCYGPDGYIVHQEGGAAGPNYHMHNEIWSPILCWPEGSYDGATLAFSVWRHESLIFGPSGGMFYIWHVRSSAADTGWWPCPDGHPVADPPYAMNDQSQAPFWPEDTHDNWTLWEDRNYVYYGGPDCARVIQVVSDLLEPGRKYVQAALGVWEYGWVWGFFGTDGTPAPYYDDVQLLAYVFPGPAISTRELQLAQDNFPAIGTIDYAQPCKNSIRFDVANNIALPDDDPCNVPGDSLTFDIVPVRTGSELVGTGEMVYRLKPNPVFDACRTSGLSNSGSLPGRLTFNSQGVRIADRYNFDLPDTGFFFPGDVIHYYIKAEDDLGGMSTLPGDTTGFSTFPGDPGYLMLRYPSSYVVRGLPSLKSMAEGDHPPVLWWNDFANRGLENEWYHALACIGHDREGVDFDTYYTNAPSSGVGNGLGGRATASQLAGYRMLLYSSGDLQVYTISNGDCENDPGQDSILLENWLLQGNKCLLLTGNDVVYDLNNSGAQNLAFENTWIQAELVRNDVHELIPDAAPVQASPLPPGNPVLAGAKRWAVYSACNPIYRFPDALRPEGTAVSIAEWLDGDCLAGAYDLAAGLWAAHPSNVDVFTLPYDLGWIIEDTQCGGNDLPGHCPVRAELLRDVMTFCGHPSPPMIIAVPPAVRPEFKAYPTPFNPQTTIEYVIGGPSRVAIKVYDLRGRLVVTLIDQQVEQSGSVTWRGRDAGGGEVASGVYFVVGQADGRTIDRFKITLLK